MAKQYPKEVIEQVLALRASGKTRKELAFDYGMSRQTLYLWEKKYRGGSIPFHSSRGMAALPYSQRREISRMGGLTISRDKAHMSELGKKGGFKVSRDKEHMSRIGKIGGASPRRGRI